VLSDQPAQGGEPATTAPQGSRGGKGGAGATLAGEKSPSQSVSGGGGGAAGRIRLNYSGKSDLVGTISPYTSSGAATTGEIPTRPVDNPG
jgi:hypothetical protein